MVFFLFEKVVSGSEEMMTTKRMMDGRAANELKCNLCFTNFVFH